MKIPDFNLPKIKIKFGKTSESEKPKVICPKCGSPVVIYNSLVKEWSCKCKHYWREK